MSRRRRLTIDWVAVKQARVARGLSHVELTERVGATAPYASYRLWHDDDHDAIALGVLERLCLALDLHPTDLFGPRPRRRSRTPAAAEASDTCEDSRADSGPDIGAGEPVASADVDRPADTTGPSAADVATAGAAIAALSAPVTRDRLADTLGWPLARLMAAIDTLEHHLAATGARVVAEDHVLSEVEPRHGLLTAAQRHALHHHGAAGSALTEAAGRTLYRLAILEARLSEPDRSSDNPTAIELQAHGLLRRRAPTINLAVTEDVRYSLMLDETPTEIATFHAQLAQRRRPRRTSPITTK